VSQYEHVQVLETDAASSVIISFISDGSDDHRPKKFLVTVSRFYPHDAPDIRLAENPTSFSSEFIAEGGAVHHPCLSNQWSAIGSLATIIDVLDSIRSCCCFRWEDDCMMETSPGTEMDLPRFCSRSVSPILLDEASASMQSEMTPEKRFTVPSTRRWLEMEPECDINYLTVS
jgi:hypothetical protein